MRRAAGGAAALSAQPAIFFLKRSLLRPAAAGVEASASRWQAHLLPYSHRLHGAWSTELLTDGRCCRCPLFPLYGCCCPVARSRRTQAAPERRSRRSRRSRPATALAADRESRRAARQARNEARRARRAYGPVPLKRESDKSKADEPTRWTELRCVKGRCCLAVRAAVSRLGHAHAAMRPTRLWAAQGVQVAQWGRLLSRADS